MDIMYNLQKTFIALYLIHFNLCHGNNWHYSLSSIYKLFDLEVEHIMATEAYIKNEYKRLEDIKMFIEQRKKQNEKELAESYTESSINAFKTILRIKNDWETLKNKTAQTTPIGEFKDKSVTYDNIVSGLKAIRRLQIIYELDTQDISNWNIGGHPSQPFDVNDCYDMASLCYDNAEYHCAYWWFVEVYDRNKRDGNKLKIDYSTFMKKFAWSSYLVGDVDGAMYILEEHAKGTNEINDDIINMRFTVWAGNNVFKRNTADDHDKKFYSYSLQLEKLSIDTNEDISLRKVASFRKHNDQVFETIHHRLAQISSKPTTNIVDKYVVTNYGIGGHYLPHTKYIDDNHLINSKRRDAIVIIHMDDVPEGGATVLPNVEFCVPSVKGSALVIYSTRNTLPPIKELFEFAQYGSCPIVYGDKWTLTAWLK
ncbi:prolyl 4-hydroxylase subunit alpha-1 isoform X2 [Acyrthosiphon pisum]|uniref:Prolyl 4-hydroxylase alpha subunit domain-containing protein n=1 Tax=Acyrthosiphon pisum TaxID=7029 RepID=A0A8R2H7J0_ACYPI|nr:prolyl 4-hydroxylase subunit alpha-1 isoform X2 [Acyrthosiphon pisum]|eukprot:XP_016659455.1 PREDICTED: prolyl 4-hydroxylase subunit alpha-1 isoform X3 [Acyrthosiphon pisum]